MVEPFKKGDLVTIKTPINMECCNSPDYEKLIGKVCVVRECGPSSIPKIQYWVYLNNISFGIAYWQLELVTISSPVVEILNTINKEIYEKRTLPF